MYCVPFRPLDKFKLVSQLFIASPEYWHFKTINDWINKRISQMYHCGKVSDKMRKQAWKPYTDIVPCNARNPQSSRCTDHDKKSLGDFCIFPDAYSAVFS